MVRASLDPRRGLGRRRNAPVDRARPGPDARGSVAVVSVLWLIPSAVLAVAGIVLARGVAGAAREMRALHESVSEVDATLEALGDAVTRTRTALGADGPRPGSASGAPRLR